MFYSESLQGSQRIPTLASIKVAIHYCEFLRSVTDSVLQCSDFPVSSFWLHRTQGVVLVSRLLNSSLSYYCRFGTMLNRMMSHLDYSRDCSVPFRLHHNHRNVTSGCKFPFQMIPPCRNSAVNIHKHVEQQ